MAHVVSFINLKGGVGKTTTCVGVAEMLASDWAHGQKVLVIDLDPQTNATTMLIGEERWEKANDQGHTLATLFADALADDPGKRRSTWTATLIEERVRRRRRVRRGQPRERRPAASSLELIDFQDRLGEDEPGPVLLERPDRHPAPGDRPAHRRVRLGADRLPPEHGDHHAQRPPDLGRLRHPDDPRLLSTYGIPQILTRAKAFGDNIGETIEPLGVIISKYRDQSSLHQETVKRLRANEAELHVFKTRIPERNTTAMRPSTRRADVPSAVRLRRQLREVTTRWRRELRDLVGDLEPAVA